MIDMHCHILPSVDDGPDTLEDSLKMIEVAYKDGIRTMVATPHINHYIDFKAKMTIEESFSAVKKEVSKRFPDMNIYLGSELFVSDGYLDIVESIKDKLAINNKKYILIEFQRNIEFEKILDVVHEVRIRGYFPIIAHVELYPCLIDSKEKIVWLRKEGGYIQINGSSILGKQGKEVASYLRLLIAECLVDFVASDGHSEKIRRPLLSKARKTVVKYSSEKYAKILFEKNPLKVINGERIVKPRVLRRTKYKKYARSRLNFFASIAAAVLMVAVGASLMGNGNIVKAEKIDLIEPITSCFNLNTIIKTDSDKEEKQIDSEETIDINNDEIIATMYSSEDPIKSKDDIDSEYRGILESLRDDYESRLEIIFNEIQTARSSIKDDEERTNIIEDYISEIEGMENALDNQVYQVLYEMQNELESYGYNVSKVQEFRDEYNQTKMEKRQEYSDRFSQ
ncbi:MAG: hypothetical protein PHY47_24390 [Lachnospiraceae bacterium]|nr:hypothetical protein [Lachnospiraceae bacterium]